MGRQVTGSDRRPPDIAVIIGRRETSANIAVYQILIVEDDPDVAQVLETLLGERHEVRVAGDGDEALACAVGFVPEVAIVDLGLPGMDGLQVARRLRNLFGRSVRLIAFSGWRNVTEDQATAAGFDVMLHKPASTERLLHAVEDR